MPLFVEENTERVEREKAAPIMVVIGNPPYNVGQKNENDNNLISKGMLEQVVSEDGLKGGISLMTKFEKA